MRYAWVSQKCWPLIFFLWAFWNDFNINDGCYVPGTSSSWWSAPGFSHPENCTYFLLEILEHFFMDKLEKFKLKIKSPEYASHWS